MAQWRPVNFKVAPIVYELGDGVNTGLTPFSIKDSEATDMSNLSGRGYPSLRTRQGRELVTQITTPNAISQRGNADIHVLDGTVWKYWNGTAWVNVKTGLADAKATIKDFARGTDRYTVLMNGTDRFAWNGTADTELTDAPLSSMFTVHKGRIYAALDNDIKFCALNDITDWSTANDAGTIDVTYAMGNITAITEYNDHVIVFTEFSMHELYGDGPDTYDLINVEGRVGCVSNNSLVVCNKRLYWLWHDGVYEYGGGSIKKISNAVKTYIDSVSDGYKSISAAGAWNEYLYLSIATNGATENNTLLVYDTDKGKWYVESGEFIGFTTIGNVIYGVTKDGDILNIRTGNDDDGTPIEWYHISKAFNDNALNYKALQDIEIVYETTGELNIGYSTSASSTSFTTLAETTDFITDGQKHRGLILAHQMQNVEWYRLKLWGTGQATVDFVQRNVVVQRKAR